jgi:hypothetical protein
MVVRAAGDRRWAVLRYSLGCSLACCGVAWSMLGCSGGPPRAAPEVDCSIVDDYDLTTLQPMEGTTASWFNFGDPTPGAIDTYELRAIPEGRCESTTALVLTARGHTDWGAGFGEYQTAMAPVDATNFEGVSFWARAAGFGTSSSFTFTINDRNTNPNGMVCIERTASDVLGGDYTYNEGGMIVPAGGELPSPEDCGNGFQRAVSAYREWYLHRIPFEVFQQTADPNLISSGIDRSGLYQFSIRIPKDSNIELWIDDLGLYRPREAAEATGQSPE